MLSIARIGNAILQSLIPQEPELQPPGSSEESVHPAMKRASRRTQFFSGFVLLEQIAERAAPCVLRTRKINSGRASLPAMEALRYLETQFSQLALEWGPGGSIGYEIATGHFTAAQDSDLDLIIRAPARLELAFATDLRAMIKAAPAQVDSRAMARRERCCERTWKRIVSGKMPPGHALSDLLNGSDPTVPAYPISRSTLAWCVRLAQREA
jgi:hypothetical protein